jgi:hypothetical protein
LEIFLGRGLDSRFHGNDGKEIAASLALLAMTGG